MTNFSVPTAAPNLPCREFPCNAPDHIGDDTDALNAAIRDEPPLSWYPGEEAVILPPDFLEPSP